MPSNNPLSLGHLARGLFLFGMELNKKLLISINDARKLIGNESVLLSDNDVENIIMQLTFLAEIAGSASHKQVFKELVPKYT